MSKINLRRGISMNKKLVVLFPGGKYSTDCPLLYYAGFKYEVLGYDKKCVNISKNISQNLAYEDFKLAVKNETYEQLKDVSFSDYEEILFISKSIGGVVAGWIQDKLQLIVKHIFLTPIPETLSYLKRDRGIKCVICGTNDKKVDLNHLHDICTKEEILLHLIEGVGHRLEVFGDMNKNIDILKEIVSLY